MRCIVCIKQVPLPGQVSIDPATNNLKRGDAAGVINPFDRQALEAAFKLKQQHHAQITVLSMGPPQFEYSLRQALSLGADEAVLLSSAAFAGADTLATAYVLTQAIKKLGKFDIIFFGRHAIDADTGQVGPIVAEYLNLPQATFALQIELEADKRLLVQRRLEHSLELVRLTLPAVVTVDSIIQQPRYAHPRDIMRAAAMPITIWDETDLACDSNRVGMAGSRTVVNKIFAPPIKSGHKLLGPPEQTARAVAQLLAKRNLLPVKQVSHE